MTSPAAVAELTETKLTDSTATPSHSSKKVEVSLRENSSLVPKGSWNRS